MSQINCEADSSEDMEDTTFGIKDIGMKKVVLFALKVTSGILVRPLKIRTLRFSMIAEKHMARLIRQKKCIQVEMNAILEVWNLVFSELIMIKIIVTHHYLIKH